MTSTFQNYAVSSSALRSATKPLGTGQVRSKKGEMNHIECKVCGDDANGFNFGAIVCESCKSFYRRHAHRRPKFRCLMSGKCTVTVTSRRHCSACRLRKCFAVGMKRPDVDDSELFDVGVPEERRNRLNLLAARLNQRIESRNTANSVTVNEEVTKNESANTSSFSSNCASTSPSVPITPVNRTNSSDASNSCATMFGIDDYEDLCERVNAATLSMLSNFSQSPPASSRLHSSSHLNEVNRRPTNAAANEDASLSDAVVIRLAMNNYVHALKHFPQVLRMDEQTLRRRLSERILEQLNLYSLFAVNEDASGWRAVDASGVLREQRFSDFIECLERDGVDARVYVKSFQDLATSLRSRFETDWAKVLVIIGIIDLCSTSLNASRTGSAFREVGESERVRRKFQNFLKSYLDRRYGNGDTLFHFCSHEFIKSLNFVADTQRCMLFGLYPPSEYDAYTSDRNCLSSALNLMSTEIEAHSRQFYLFKSFLFSCCDFIVSSICHL